MNLSQTLKDLTLQEYITLGYIILVALGALNINIYYSAFDVNIFDFISVSDILLAPINMLFLDYKYTGFLFLKIGFITFLFKYLIQGLNYLINKFIPNLKKPITIGYQPFIIFMLLFSYLFLKMSTEMAESVASSIDKKDFKLTKTITFTDNTQKDVRVIAVTSVYIFYFGKGDSQVNISPLSNVKTIQRNNIPY